MVTRQCKLVLSALLMLLTTSLHAQTTLELSVDKNKIYQNEVVNLTVQADSAIDFSLGGLMNFGGGNVDEPVFDNIEQNWEIIDRQQSYNMRSINGNNQSLITWRYALSPKHQGILTIPSATFKNAKSETLSIDVLVGTRPRNAQNPPSVFLEASVDKSNPYLQEQVVYTLSLYTLGEARGDMSEPTSADFIIESVGDTTKTFKMAYNRRYEVYERSYLIFPQKSGDLTIESPAFSGTVIDQRTRRRTRANESGNALTVTVKSPPTSFTGDTWLPATSLFLSETLDPNTAEIAQGESVTRTINMTALGLLGSALPELKVPKIQGMKVYPDQAEVDAIQHAQGVQSSRTEAQALVAISAGTVTLPALSVKWWDTINDVEREANISARTLTITPSAVTTQDNTSATKGGSPIANISNPSDSLEANDPSSFEASSTEASSTQANSNIVQADNGKQSSSTDAPVLKASQRVDVKLWIIAIAGLVLAWAMHSLFLYRKINALTQANSQLEVQPNNAFDDALKQTIDAVKNNTPNYLIRTQKLLEDYVTNGDKASQIQFIDLANIVEQINHVRYSANASSENHQTDNDLATLRQALVSALTACKQHSKPSKINKDNELKPFYPA